jgi:non-specific serine/threonine protein kinase/serine/threonine-protein kinase
MNAPTEQRLRSLFDAALKRPPDRRAEFLYRQCRDDPELKARVEALLSCDEREVSFLDTPLLTADGKAVLSGAAARWDRQLPERLGRYRVVREVGSGSMGTVFEAELESPKRSVAVKVLRPGVSTTPMLRRFQFEAEVLKRLDHPLIARFYDSGTTDSGQGPQPFFAMEFVEGRVLTDYATEQALSAARRLELLAGVCDAVHHAHTKGVIHRDLKPSNILVDASGRPRVLDFGVARALHGDLGSYAGQTGTGQLVGTLRYMSPEQAQGDPAEVDTRSDVYSLGVIGFELLSGRPPFEVDRMALAEAVRTLVESDAPRLGSLRRELRGDVETIIAKALEKDRDRRYPSASDLAADIRRFLGDEPILARAPSVMYRLSKYARRNKAWFTGAVTALVIFVVGLLGTGYGFVNALKSRREADTQRAIAVERLADAEAARDESEAMTRLLARMLESVDPTELGRDVLVRDVLDEAAATIGDELSASPLVEARLRHTLGSTYLSLGIYPEAGEHLQSALDIRRRFVGEDDRRTLQTAARLIELEFDRGRYDEAGVLLHDTLQCQRRVLGARHPDTLGSMNMLAVLRFSRADLDESERAYKEVWALQREVLGETHPDTLDTAHNLGLVYTQQGRYDDADRLLREVLERARQAAGDDDPGTLKTMHELARVAQARGRFDEAEAMFRDALVRQEAVLGGEHPATLTTKSALAHVYTEWGRLEDAGRILEDVLAVQRRVVGESHGATRHTMNRLALLRHAQGRFEEAEALHLELLEHARRRLGGDHPGPAAAMNSLANLYTDMDRFGEAEALHLKALAIQRRELGDEHPDTLWSMHNLAGLRVLQGRLEEAEPMCRKVLEIQQRQLGKEHPDTQKIVNMLTVIYESLGRHDEAEAMYLETLDIQRRTLGDQHEQVLATMNNLGDLYNNLERFEEAEAVLGDLVRSAAAALPPDHWYLGVFRTKYGVALAGLERVEEAERTLLEAYAGLSAALGPEHHRARQTAGAIADLFDHAGRTTDAETWRERARPADASHSDPPAEDAPAG